LVDNLTTESHNYPFSHVKIFILFHSNNAMPVACENRVDHTSLNFTQFNIETLKRNLTSYSRTPCESVYTASDVLFLTSQFSARKPSHGAAAHFYDEIYQSVNKQEAIAVHQLIILCDSGTLKHVIHSARAPIHLVNPN
jgi:hypothetical protein